MRQKQRVYDFGIENLEKESCSDLKGHIISYGDVVVKRIEEHNPCNFTLTLFLYSCGGGSIDQFCKVTRKKYPHIIIKPISRQRGNGKK